MTTPTTPSARPRPYRRLAIAFAFGLAATVFFILAGARDAHVHPVAQRANGPLPHDASNRELPFVVVERDSTRDTWRVEYGRVESGRTPIDDETARRAGFSPAFRALADGDVRRAEHLRAGWPFRAAEAFSFTRADGEGPIAVGGLIAPRSLLDRRHEPGTVLLPLRPLVGGFAADVALFTALAFVALSYRAHLQRTIAWRWSSLVRLLALGVAGGVVGTFAVAWWAGAYNDAESHAFFEKDVIGFGSGRLLLKSKRGATRVAWDPIAESCMVHPPPAPDALDHDWLAMSPLPDEITLEAIASPHRAFVELRGWPWPALAARTSAEFDGKGRAIPESIRVSDAIVLETRANPDGLPTLDAGRDQSLARFLPLHVLPRGFALDVGFFGAITLLVVWLLDPLLPLRAWRRRD